MTASFQQPSGSGSGPGPGAGPWPGIAPAELRLETHHGAPCLAWAQRPHDLAALLLDATARSPQREILVCQGERLTYAEFVARVRRLAGLLRDDCGVRQGDRVALLLVNGLPLAVAVFAVAWLGAVAVPLNTKQKAAELSLCLTDAAPRALLLNPDWWAAAASGVAAAGVEHLVVTRDAAFPVKAATAVGLPPADALVLEDRLAAPDCPVAAEPALVKEHDAALLLYTSGTTGRPKGAVISHWNLANAVVTYQRTLDVGTGDRTVIAVPMFHVTGLIAQFLLLTHAGGCSVVLPAFDAGALLDALQAERATFFHAAPTVYLMLLRHAGHAAYRLDAWRTAVAGGSATPAEVVRELRAWLPQLRFHTAYGLTETSSPAVVMPAVPERERRLLSGSCGLPIPVAECKVVGTGGQELGPGEAGELLLRGATVAEGYWANPAATRATFAGGWLRTGDVARIDAGGWVHLLDRLKDMINRGAEKVYSIEVEDVLHAHPDVVEAAVIGIPDPLYGETVKAVVVARPGSGLDEAAVRRWVAERLAGYKVPSAVAFLAALPRNPNGKVQKGLLRSNEARRTEHS